MTGNMHDSADTVVDCVRKSSVEMQYALESSVLTPEEMAKLKFALEKHKEALILLGQ